MSASINSTPSRRAHPCELCNKSFNSTHQLAQHSRVHSGEKPYKCSFCERKFKQLSHVQQHTRLHTGERPYKCTAPNCGRSFIQLSNLQQHMKTHTSIDKIVKESEKKFFCSHCGKGFKGQSSLLTHESKKHSDELSPIELFLNKESRNLVQFNCQLAGKVNSNENKKRVESHCSNVPSPSSSDSPNSSIAFQLFTCNDCSAVFANEFAFLSHLEEMRNDPKHHESKLLLNSVLNKEGTQNIHSLTHTSAEDNSNQNERLSSTNISASMLVESILQMNQNSLIDNSLSSEPSNCTN